MVDDERRAEALEVFDRQLEIFELELAAVEVDRAARLQAQQPERNRHLDDPLVVGIEGEDVELIRAAACRRGRAVRVGAQEVAALVELDERLLTGELRLDAVRTRRVALAGDVTLVSKCFVKK